MREILEIEIPNNASLQKDCSSICSKLRSALQAKSKGQAVILLKSADDESRICPIEDSELLFEELQSSLKELNQTLFSLRNHHSPVVFWGSGICLSQQAEFAVAAHVRVWSDVAGVIGFPEIRAGAVPPSLADPKSRTITPLQSWQDAPIIDVKNSLSSGFVDAVMEYEALATYLRSCSDGALSGLLKRSPLSPPSNWQERGQVQTYCHAVLTDRVRLALSRQPITSQPLSTENYCVVFEVSKSLPPAPSLIRTLQSGTKVKFASSNGTALLAAIETISGRLQRALSQEAFHRYWTQSVSWGVYKDRKTKYPTYVWQSDETLEVQLLDEVYNVVMSGSHDALGGKDLPAFEVPESKYGDQLRSALELVGKVIVLAPKLNGSENLTALLRLAILVEICRTSKFTEGKVLTTCDHLRRSGWSIIGNDIFWQRFFNTSEVANHPLWMNLPGIGPKGFFNSWRDIVSWCQQKYGTTGTSWPNLAISQHLAIFVWHFVDTHILPIVRSTNNGTSVEDVWSWAIAATGFPIGYGTPCQYALSWDRRRIAHTVRTYWSQDGIAIQTANA